MDCMRPHTSGMMPSPLTETPLRSPCTPGELSYGDRTYAYRFDDLVLYHCPVPYARKHGVVIWERVPLAKELRHV